MRTPARIREIKREYMRRARLDPEKRARWNRFKREQWESTLKPLHQEYKRQFKAKHFFRWQAMNWPHAKLTAKELAMLWKQQRGLCALSGRKLGRDAHLDHRIPKSHGGAGGIDNLRWLDPVVNMMRHNMTDEQFFALCLQIGRRIIEAEKLSSGSRK